MDERSQYINDALIRIYSDILWIEEKELRKSRFNDLTIKEMHAINAVSMYDHKTVKRVMLSESADWTTDA